MNNPWHHLLDTVNLCRIFTVLLLCHLNVKEKFQHNEHARHNCDTSNNRQKTTNLDMNTAK